MTHNRAKKAEPTEREFGMVREWGGPKESCILPRLACTTAQSGRI